MISSRRRDWSLLGTSLSAIVKEVFPLIRRTLKRVQIICYQIVEEVTFNLATEYVYSRSKDIECMSVSA